MADPSLFRLSITARDHKLILIRGGLIMGLDMYLTAEKYVFSDEQPQVNQALAEVGFNTKSKAVRTIGVEIMTWRKANQIHRWFVENIQKGEDDCKRYYVSLDKLRELVAVCQKVLQNHSIAIELLPTQEGFFFGSYEYDEMYFLDIQETLTFLEPVIKDQTWENWDFYYQSSW
jgi:hypothetical protein